MKKTLKKASEIYVEGIKTSAQDLGQMLQGNTPPKRGIVGRLKQAAAIGATMLTLGGIGSIKNSIENSQAESQREAEIHYVQQKHGWQVSIDENSPLWNTQNNTGIPKYRSTQQQNDHQKYLDLISGYIRSLRGEGYVFSEKDDPANRLENVMNEINGKIDDLKNLSQQFGSKNTTKRLQMMAKVKAEMNKIAKKMNTQSTARGRVDMLSNALRNVNQQKPQTMAQYNAMEMQSFRD